MNNVLNEASTSHRSWNNLSMQEKAAMIRVAVRNGLTDLKTIREKYNEFAEGGRKDDGWTLEDENKYQLWRASLPDNLKNTNDDTYDMRAAFKAGMQPVLLSDGYYHLGSRDPETGRILKAPYHPTYLQAINTDARMGYYPSIDNKGNTYTDTWVGNQFARGGSKKKKSTSTISPYAQRAMDYFMKKGLSKHAAAGLVGNLMRESNFNVTATNPYSGAYGLAQWLGSRKDRLFAKYGKNPTFDQQLDFAWWELNNTHKKGLQRLLNAPTAADAAADAMGYYEFSAGRQGAINDMAKHKQDGIGAMKKGIANANLLMGLPADSYSIELPSVATQPVETSGYQPVPAFMPNPEIFATVPAPTTYTTEYPEVPTAPVVEYDPKEAERQEKRDNLNRFNMFLGMLNGSNESTFPFSMFAEGGGIHIKPENRGKFTALKERTGHSATWFKEHGTPAQKKMAVFDLNSRHWKHGLGGNLFEDGGPKKPLTRDDLRRMLLNRRTEAETAYNGSVTETQIIPNDNAWVDKPLTRRKKNPHSSRRAEEGAKAHAAWEREHPNLAAWGNLAGAVPFAVAAAPLGAGIVAGGDALAATTAGQAITAGLAPLATAASTSIAGAPLYTWADVGLSSLFGGHGIQTAINEGGISPTTALEIAPLGRLARPMYEGIVQPGMRLFNSPLTGNWTKIGNREYRLSPYSLGANGSPLESRSITTELNISPEELYKALQEQEGYYFMGHGTGRTNVDPEVIFNNGLRIKNGDIANTTSPLSESNLVTWPHANSKEVIILPARAENTMFDSAHGRIPSDWYDANTFQWIDDPGFEGSGLFAVQKPNASFVETVVNGVPGVYTKPGAILGSYNTDTHVLRLNPNSQYKFPFSANTASKITAENAASIAPEQWTAAQDAAIARGDIAEAQRLRDLHFKVSAPNTKVVDTKGNPQLVIHKTPNDFTVFDNSRSIGNLNWAATPKAFEGENGVFATGAGPNPKDMPLYVNMRNPHYPTIEEGMEPAFINEGEDGILGIVDKDMTDYFESSSKAGEGFNMSLGVDNPYALKSADAVTYDNNGVRIPLGKRDNFNINDIRYGLLPFGIGLTGYGLLPGK